MLKGCQGVFGGCYGVFRGCLWGSWVFRFCCVSETAQVELKCGRVQAPASTSSCRRSAAASLSVAPPQLAVAAQVEFESRA